MRKYLTPAMDMEAFDVEDIITVSGAMNQQNLNPDESFFFIRDFYTARIRLFLPGCCSRYLFPAVQAPAF